MMTHLTEFQREIVLNEEDKLNYFWVQDDVHLAHAVSPLFASFQIPAMTKGTKTAFENLKMPLRQFMMKLADGRLYQATLPYEGDMTSRIREHQELVGPLLPIQKQSLMDSVEHIFSPFYRQLDAYRSQTATLDEAKQRVEELFAFYEKAWQLHFEIMMPRSGHSMALEELYARLTNESDATAVYECLSGVMNKTLETDRELWKLAVQVKRSTVLEGIFTGFPTEEIVAQLDQQDEGRAFLTGLRAFLEMYGYRSPNSHEFLDETWIENPNQVLYMISAYLQKEYDFEKEYEQIVQKREEKVRETLAKMPEGEGKQAFIQLHQWALEAWGLDEDHHFYIDAMLPAKSRLFLLRVGEMLVEASVVEAPNDIFFLYYDELLDVLSEPTLVSQTIERRKQEHEQNKQKNVPPVYGTPPEEVPDDPIMERVFGIKAPDVNEQEKHFSGYAASQGQYTGVVKVVRGPEDFSKVQTGDVLVCKTTTPPWTVLFSVVGAVVTDAGGILSHAGTVAREYRVPSVVGTKVATSVLRDGDIVTVDGTNGVVHFGK
ncbi:PEP-utilizing enzyme [uncultured Brevibacillus sp.]|uniref:PEP-utilizing enzyme n=1 Tax=uncultured Brevibacillus sp. TaxID=169970 RepID=UPI0025942920|nr:PEP-utilizing enzyme [uncultured Brevibacillus sp.]